MSTDIDPFQRKATIKWGPYWGLIQVNDIRGSHIPLNARQAETSKSVEKTYKLADGGGLYLLVNPNGSKYWRLKYRFAGKENKLSFGTDPDMTLAEARIRREEAPWNGMTHA